MNDPSPDVYAFLPAVPLVLDEFQSLKGGAGGLLTTVPHPSQLQFNRADT